MIKSYFTKYPLWFLIIWGCVVALLLIVAVIGLNPVLVMGGMVVLYVANAIRAWEKERLLAIVSCIFAVVFSYILYKFLTL